MQIQIKDHVRRLRQNSTDAERRLWEFLRAKRLKGYKFRRQHLLHPYIVDFVCLSKKLVVELDGGQHLIQEEYDAKRTLSLQSRGFKILRFWNDVVFEDIEVVLEEILFNLSGGD